jgi:hypothetical protein
LEEIGRGRNEECRIEITREFFGNPEILIRNKGVKERMVEEDTDMIE